MKRLIFLLILSSLIPSGGLAFELLTKGYNKTLVLNSQSFFTKQNYNLLLNRQRFDWDFIFDETWELKSIIDNEVFLGSYLQTFDFQAALAAANPHPFSMQSNFYQSTGVLDQLKIHRLYLSTKTGNLLIRTGHQRISWGTGYFWNPTDLFVPISPTSIEASEKSAATGISADYSFEQTTTFQGVGIWDQTKTLSKSGLRFHSQIADWDYSLMAINQNSSATTGMAYGFDFAGSIWGGAGLRGEFLSTQFNTSANYNSWVLSLDYAFTSSLYGLAEYFHNGAGQENPSLYAPAGTQLQLAQNYVGGQLRYLLNELNTLSLITIRNLNDSSGFGGPSLTSNLHDDLELTLGSNLFYGAPGSEYANFASSFYAILTWSF